jgi:uncharacterized repeat protein (TIGR01451 family)
MHYSSSCNFKLLVLVVLAFIVTGCNGSGSSDNNSISQSTDGPGLALRITDAPVNDSDIAEVWVRFTEVIVHPADGGDDIIHNVEDTSDPNNVLPYREIELKSLVGGKTMLLGEIPLDAGDYSWIRLVIDPDYTRIVETSGNEYLVKCPSCTQSGFKLNREFTIADTGWIDFTIDFDLRKSLTLSRPNMPRVDFDYILRPTLSIRDTELASSYIHGIVNDQHSELNPDACWVYVYEDAVTPDDICLDSDTTICTESDRPVLETPVQYDTNSGDYVYNTGFIYPGLYTAALVCEADDPNTDDDLLFMPDGVGVTVQADAVAEGAEQDFTLIEIPILTLDKTLDGNADEDGSGTVTVGDTLTYRMKVVNDGNVSLTNVTVSDPLDGLSVLSCDTALPATLAPDATLECTATYSVQSTDTSITNTATANAETVSAGPLEPVDDSVTVDVTNSAPEITSTPVTDATVAVPYSYDVEADDPNAGDVLSFSLITAPAGMSVDPATGLIEWTPAAGDVGDNTVEVMVQDQDGLSDIQNFTITVN